MIAWVALVLALVAILLWLIVAYTLRRVWRTVGPQVMPILAMFAPSPPGFHEAVDAYSEAVERIANAEDPDLLFRHPTEPLP